MSKDIDVTELKSKLDAGEDFLLIDVREPHEHQEFNVGGQLIPLGNIPASVEELYPHKDKEIVLYCRSGNRSGQAKMFLQQFGFTNLRNLEGGMLSWQETFPT